MILEDPSDKDNTIFNECRPKEFLRPSQKIQEQFFILQYKNKFQTKKSQSYSKM